MIFGDSLRRRGKNVGPVYGHRILVPCVIVTKWVLTTY